MQTIKEHFTNEELNELLALTPNRKIEEVEYALSGKGFH
jgi:hypothetical protein